MLEAQELNIFRCRMPSWEQVSLSLCPSGFPLETKVVLSLQQTFPCNRVLRWLSVDGDLRGRAVGDLFMGCSAKQVRVQEGKIKVCSL